MIQQATLFDLGDIPTSVRRQPTGGSGNPIVFHDYESYVAKFQDKEKTTDDTYTPRDVYDFQTIARGDEVFSIKKSEAMVIRDLDCIPRHGGLFGDHLLVSEAVAMAAAKAAEKAKNVIPVRLSPRERMLVERLNKNNT